MKRHEKSLNIAKRKSKGAKNELKIFKTVENETTINEKGNFTFSAICDDDGSFEVVIEGTGGTKNAYRALKRLMEIVKNG